MSKTILAEVNGFTPVIDKIVKEHGYMTALIFGRIWRFCQMKNGVCNASQDTIGKSIGVDRHTIINHAEKLIKSGYLRSTTTKGIGTTYIDTGKAGLVIKITGDLEPGNENATGCEQDYQVPGNENATKIVFKDSSIKDSNIPAEKKAGIPEPTREPCDDYGEPVKKKTNRKSSDNSNLYPIAEALADVTGMSLPANKPRIFAEAKLIAKDSRITPEIIKRDYSTGGDWYKYDWRGQKGQKPTLSQIRETMFTFTGMKNKIQGGTLIGADAVNAELARLEQEENNG